MISAHFVIREFINIHYKYYPSVQLLRLEGLNWSRSDEDSGNKKKNVSWSWDDILSFLNL